MQPPPWPSFRETHKAQAEGKTIDKELYDKAKEYYEEAFYRVSSSGPKTPLGSIIPPRRCASWATRPLRRQRPKACSQALTKAGVDVPIKVDLELNKYLDNRGEKKLKGNPNFEFKDPSGVQERF